MTINIKQTADDLEQYNKWRRGEPPFDSLKPPAKEQMQPNPKELGKTIDNAVELLRRLSHLVDDNSLANKYHLLDPDFFDTLKIGEPDDCGHYWLDSGNILNIIGQYLDHIGDTNKKVGWQLIKTAPKDGSQFLASDGSCVVMAEHPNDELIVHDITSCGISEITHWQPLPDVSEGGGYHAVSQENPINLTTEFNIKLVD